MRHPNKDIMYITEMSLLVSHQIKRKRKLIRQIRRECILKILILALLISMAWMIVPAAGGTVFAAANVPVTIEIPLQYVVEDGAGQAEETFFLTPDDPSDPMPKGTANGKCQIKLERSANTSFGAITYTRPGSFHYTVQAETDPTVFHVQVVATSDGQGNLIIRKDGSEGKSTILYSANAGLTPAEQDEPQESGPIPAEEQKLGDAPKNDAPEEDAPDPGNEGGDTEEPGAPSDEPERDAPESPDASPATGDGTMLPLWITAGMLSLLCLILLLYREGWIRWALPGDGPARNEAGGRSVLRRVLQRISLCVALAICAGMIIAASDRPLVETACGDEALTAGTRDSYDENGLAWADASPGDDDGEDNAGESASIILRGGDDVEGSITTILRSGTDAEESEPIILRGGAAEVDRGTAAARGHDLILWTNVSGNLGDLTKQFCITVWFDGLEPGKEYDALADETLIGAGVGHDALRERGITLQASDMCSVTADDAGEASVTVKLRDDEAAVFPGLPDEAGYQITMKKSDHVASYRQESFLQAASIDETGTDSGDTSSGGAVYDNPQAFFERASGTNGSLSNQPLRMVKETFDADDETILVTFRNNRDLAPITGVPGNRWTWLGALGALLTVAAAGYVKGCKSRRNPL